jgi:LmbE family N-acetylglucosaminyl deacetylase
LIRFQCVARVGGGDEEGVGGRHIYLSPHPDDAAYSCGGQIARLTGAGGDVLIYTVMAAAPPVGCSPTPFVAELHARWALGEDGAAVMAGRRAEDAAAAAALGARVAFGEAADAIYRCGEEGDALYPDVAAIFGPIHPQEIITNTALERALLPHLTDAPTAIYAPLGVGGHVDHLLVREMALRLAARFANCRLYLYEEYPYARQGRSVVERALLNLKRPVLRVQQMLDDTLITAKTAASACYRSQRSSFWASDEALAAEVRSYAQTAGGESAWLVLDRAGDD